MSQYLTIIGNVASGKSTAMPILATALQAETIHADELFQTVNPFRDQYLNDTPRWSFTSELWLTRERAKLMSQHKKTQVDQKLTLVDSGLLMSWVYSYSHLLAGEWTADEWMFYEQLFDEFAQDFLNNTAVIHLKYSPDTLMKRLKKRERAYELQFYTPKYLDQLELGLSALRKKLDQTGQPIIEISENEIADFEQNKKDEQKLTKMVQRFISFNR